MTAWEGGPTAPNLAELRGAVESAAKHVVQQRMKRAGTRWRATGGRAMLALRTHVAPDRLVAPLLRAAA